MRSRSGYGSLSRRACRATAVARSPPRTAQATPSTNARVAALRLLAARRLTEAQLWQRLAKRELAADDVRDAVAWCKAEGYLDDALFARLYVEGRRKAVGDARLIGELVRKGVDRDVATGAIARAEHTQDERLAGALERLFVREPPPSYGSAARSLERLGFPAPAIYRHLRAHASRFAISPIQGEDSPERGE